MDKNLPLKWHGGKQYLAKRIIELFPPRDSYVHYVEPYFGGGAVLFAHDPEGKSEVANDINGNLMNFWLVLRDETLLRELQHVLSLTPFAEPFFRESLRQQDFDGTQARVRRAFWFFVRYRQSRQGLGKEFATLSRNRTRRGMNEQVSAWLSAVEGLPEAHERLKRVVILNDDAVNVIRQQDGPKTLFYCDPPYLHETRNVTDAYEHEMTIEQHTLLLACLSKIKGRFLLRGYPSNLYQTAEKLYGWRREDIPIDNKASSAKTKEIKTECVWLNY